MHAMIKTLTVIGVFCLSFQASAQKSTGGSDLPDQPAVDVFIPNAFTPDGNGLNDSFKVVVNGPELEIYEFTVIDRNGREVFRTTNPKEQWDGSLEGSSYTTSPTMFIYTLRIKSIEDAKPFSYKGHIVLIR